METPKPPPPPPPKPVEDDEEARRLAEQRKDLEAKRSGRKSLVIAPNRNPGVSAVGASGLRIDK